jgi:hypothetical protein
MMNRNIKMTLPRGIPVVLAFLLLSSLALAQTPAFDIVITNGHIIDGTGSPGTPATSASATEKLAIGNLAAARASAPSTPPAKSSRPASSTCSANPNSRSWSIRACPRKSIRESRPKSPAKGIRLLRSTTP